MEYGNKLRVTFQLIKGSLFPLKRAPFPFSPQNNGESTAVAPEDFAAVLAEPDRLLRPNGTLELHFNGALSPAAPFLLFRLKRTGFSNCRAVITPQGIVLTARR